mmetsp:Transcript_93560/g.260502  ORF Transcript_93560/g.260502 Transcript_93560/m.260502 type:complete len:168 (+) Transcript_93560:113-616(+)
MVSACIASGHANSWGGAGCKPFLCRPPLLSQMQEQMPPELQCPVSEAAWQDLPANANGEPAEMNAEPLRPVLSKGFGVSIGFLLVGLGALLLACSDCNQGRPAAPAGEVPTLVAGTLLLVGSQCVFGVVLLADLAGEGLGALARGRSEAVGAGPGAGLTARGGPGPR